MNITFSETEININQGIVNLTNELSIIPKEIFVQHFLRYVSQLIKQAKEKGIAGKCIRITEILKKLIIENEINEIMLMKNN